MASAGDRHAHFARLIGLAGAHAAAGAESLVRFVGPGDRYGAIALVAGSRFPISATAVQPSRVLVWRRPVITAFAERLPQLKSNILEEITRPKNEWRGMQTALIGSSNGAVLEFIVPEAGRYVLVDHEFADASKGAIARSWRSRSPAR